MADWQLDRVREADRNRACVMFIHGFSGSPSQTWGQFPELTQNDPGMDGWDILSFGYESDLMPDIVGAWQADPEIQTIADQFRTFADNTIARYDALALLAHSMGGLVLQLALLDGPELAGRVDKAMMFGTPSFGLVKAWPFRLPILRSLNRQVRDMARGEKFIDALRHDWNNTFADRRPFDFLAVAGTEDEFVPIDASLGDFPDDICECVPGNHLQIVKPGSETDASFDLAMKFIRGEELTPWTGASMALQRRDFRNVVDRWMPLRDGLDKHARVELAIALDHLDRRAEAIKILEGSDDTDAMGVLAGRYKREWWRDRQTRHAEEAIRLYSEGYQRAAANNDAPQAYYHAINLAFFALVHERQQKIAEDWATKALEHCAAASPAERPSARMWRLATEGDAWAILADTDKAIEHHTRAATGTRKPKPWQAASIFEQASRIADELEDSRLAEDLLNLYRGTAP